MFSLTPELEKLRDDGSLDAETAANVIAIDRREVFSLAPELRLLLYGGVALITTGVGIYLARNVHRFGAITIIFTLAFVASCCYAFALAQRHRRVESVVAEYVLLLGALLLSADVGYAESHYRMLGDDWSRHFLLLALIHGVTAYFFESRFVLTLAISSLAGWLGLEARFRMFDSDFDAALRMLICSGLVFTWRYLHRRAHRTESFEPIFEHYATHLAFWGALLLLDDKLMLAGFLLVAAASAFAIGFGFRHRRELFVIYGIVYGWIAVSYVILEFDPGDVLALAYFVLSIATVVVVLVTLHKRFKRASTNS